MKIIVTSLVTIMSLFVQLIGSAQQVISLNKTAFNITSASIVVDSFETVLVRRSAAYLQADIEKVTGKKIPLLYDIKNVKGNYILVGTAIKSAFIKQLVNQKKLSLSIASKWEAYQIKNLQISSNQNCLVVAGSDRRGVAYGVFELSKQMGVSPLYWWADVAIKKQAQIYINNNVNIIDSPAVKYRGIFINDEAPALSSWTKEKFGGFNHSFYEHVFELILRLKGNYLWPAMWGSAFNADDTLSPIKADEYGIVMGTSHHEPMLRAQQEWKKYGKGAWDYTKNDTILRSFWKKGIVNMGSHESLITIGMRGDGDMPMTQGTATELLEKIVADQRKILAEVTQKPASETPQLWALYKEVQDYYDKGMRVPDDVTLLLCDDNWGNIRKLPALTDPKRGGGYGIYYHFDYVGGPRNYKWINTNNIVRVWEQMHMAYEHDVRNIWIVNVGDIKPMELPISFFLDYAWKPSAWNENNIGNYYTAWSETQFGKEYATSIGNIARKYAQLAAAKKPELIDRTTFSLNNYREFDKTVGKYQQLLDEAEKINTALPADNRDAFYQLILHPVKAMANLIEMYYNAALNKAYYPKKWGVANTYADKVKELYKKDSLISKEYHTINNGKWNGMMNQTHIGYTSWQEPRTNKMPEVSYVPSDSIASNKLPLDTISASISASHLIPKNSSKNIFYELNGYVSMQAANATKLGASAGSQLKIINDIGRDGDGIAVFPVTTPADKLKTTDLSAEYEFYTYSSGSAKVQLSFSPTLNFLNLPEGLQYAVTIDNAHEQIVSLNKNDNNGRFWNKWVSDAAIQDQSQHIIAQPGKHTLKIRFYNAGIVLQKIIIDLGGLKPSYFGPAETLKNYQTIK